MTKSELASYRQRLLALARSVRGHVDGAADEALRRTGADPSGNLSNVPVHLADLSSDTYEHEVALSLLENEGALLDQIVGALQRFEAGTFGRCQACGCDIPSQRLQAVPYTPYCIACAEKAEKGELPG